MTTSAKCHALASKIGCELDVDRRHRTVTINLPEGKQIEGNPGLNCRVNNCETMDEAWTATYADLNELADGGMEPMAAHYAGCE